MIDLSKNKLNINCPIFRVSEPIASCLSLYEKYLRGEPMSVRCGCRALMHCGACPMWFVRRELKTKRAAHYYSDTPMTRAVSSEAIHHIARTIVSLKVLSAYGVSDAERARLMEVCNIYHRSNIEHALEPLKSEYEDRDVYHAKPRKNKEL